MQARSTSGARRRRLVAVVVTAAALTGLASVVAGSPPAGAQGPPKPEAASPEAALAAAAGAGARVVEAAGGGPVTFVGTPPGEAVDLSSPGRTPRGSAQAFVEEFGAAFGEAEPDQDLTVERLTPMAAGGKAVHYQQFENGVPVLAGELNVQVTASGKVRSAGGELSTGTAVDIAAGLNKLPTNYFSTLGEHTADIDCDMVNGTFTVSIEAWYDIEFRTAVAFLADGSSPNPWAVAPYPVHLAVFKTPAGGSAAIDHYFGSVVRGYAYDVSAVVSPEAISGHTRIYLQKGDKVGVGTNANSARAGFFTGDTGGLSTHFTITLANRSTN